MIIGLEGCDGTGKSSLAEAVRDEIQRRVDEGSLPKGNVELLHRGPPERSVFEEYTLDIDGREDEHLVFDRWHLGTCVYAPLYRGTGPYGELGATGFEAVEKFLQRRGAVFYVIDLPYETVKARLEARGEDYLQAKDVEGVLDRFRVVSAMSVLTDGLFTPQEGVENIEDDARRIVEDAIERTLTWHN